MKKQKHQIIFIAIVAAYFLLNVFIPREKPCYTFLETTYSGQSFKDWPHYQDFLVEEGYSFEEAEHIAKVEFEIIEADEVYYGYIED